MEQRRIDRVKQRLEIKYCVPSNQNITFQTGWSEDIGLGGICLNLLEEMPVGERVRFAIRKSLNGDWLPEVDGIVVWQQLNNDLEESRKATGIYFSPDQVLLRKSIRELIGNNITSDRKNYYNSETETSSSEIQIEPAYDGSKVTFKFLRLFGWGPLNNLGYFRFASPIEFLNLVEAFINGKMLFLIPEAQRKLVVNSIKLLNLKKGDKVLDIACGKGMSSFLLAHMHPETIVTGIDVLPRNINASRALYGGGQNLRFSIDNAMELGLNDQTIDKMMCVEAAFHFPDKRKFLEESHRVLRPGGKLVIVDFMWKNDISRLSKDDPETKLVKSEWQWDDFFSIPQYLETAKNIGFAVQAKHIWSGHVTGPLEHTFKTVAYLGNNKLGRSILNRINPMLRCLTDDEWRLLLRSALAHDHVRKYVEYVALVLTKR